MSQKFKHTRYEEMILDQIRLRGSPASCASLSPHESDHALHIAQFYFGVTLEFSLESLELPVESVTTTLEFPLESFELQV